MNDRAATTDAPPEATRDEPAETIPPVPAVEEAPSEPAPAPTPDEKPPEAVLPSLEDRVRALEVQLAVVRDTRKLEDRLVERMAKRLERKQASAALKAPVAAIADAGKRLIPIAVATVQARANAATQVAAGTIATKQPWLIVDCWTELRSMFRMFFDPRYRLTWQTKVYPPILIALMVLWWWILPSIPVLTTVLDKIVTLVLAFFLYKILSREARRYREVCPHLPPALYSP
jgi:hypothetical protein